MTDSNTNNRRGTISPSAGGVVKGRARRGLVRSSSSEIPQNFRIASLNVGTLRGRADEVVETMSRRKVDLCCLQETRWRGGSARMLKGKDSRYKLFWSGNDRGTAGVGFLLAEKWIEKVFDVQRISDRIILMKLIIGSSVLTFLSVYAPQCGLSDAEKDTFYVKLREAITKTTGKEFLFLCGDWNGHIGKASAGFEEVHGGCGFGDRNTEGERILEFATANNLAVGNSWFQKDDNHLITYDSGGAKTQVDYILLRRADLKRVKNIKVIPGEECATQHRLLVCDFLMMTRPEPPVTFQPKVRTWKLKEQEVQKNFHDAFVESTKGYQTTDVEGCWLQFKEGLLSSAGSVCGQTKKRFWRKETWWWDEEVNIAIQAKRKCFKAWKKGGSKDEYNRAKCVAKKAVYSARHVTALARFSHIDPNGSDIFKVAKQMRRENQDVLGENCVIDDDGELSLDNKAKHRAWQQHYEKLLNTEFSWNPDHLSQEEPVQGPPIEISPAMIEKALDKMKNGKAPGPSGIVAEMMKASGKVGSQIMSDLANAIIREECVPESWEESYIINCYKGKGDARIRGNYRGLKLLEQAMKVIERVADSLIREQVDIDEMQYGFTPGRGTTDAIFILRQMQEKYVGSNKRLYMAFVDLEKAFDRVPREVLWWAMRKVGVEEWLIRLVQSMYTNARSRVRVDDTYSDDFSVKVGVHQGSVLSPLLFIIVLEALSKEFRTGCPWELLYADDLVIVDETMEKVMDRLKVWKDSLEAKGLRVNLSKTKVMISGPELQTLKDSGQYPCAVCRNGVRCNAIQCSLCTFWVHKKCSGISGKLKADPNYKCKRCLGQARPLDGRPYNEVMVDNDPLEVVDSFCYLGDMLSAGGGCELSSTVRVKSAWKKFRELLPVLTSRSIPLITRGRVYSSCVRSVLLYGSECWALTQSSLARLQRNDRAMIRWICNVKSDQIQQVRSEVLLDRLQIPSLELLLRANRLRWFGHVERSNAWINRCRDVQVESCRRAGRPKKTWKQTISNDREIWKMDKLDPHDRDAWRHSIATCQNRRTPE